MKRCLKVGLIRQTLRNLPKTLDDTYSRIFSGIDEAYRQEAKSALIWLAFAERPLQLEELAEATIIHPSSDPPFDPEERFPEPQNVLQILSSLVTVRGLEKGSCEENLGAYIWNDDDPWNSSSNPRPSATITLAHYSVKEYLISDRIKQSGDQFFAINPTTSHAFIAESCLHYIMQYVNFSTTLGAWPADLQTLPLLDYTARYWSTHINSMPQDDQMALNSLVLKLLLSAPYLPKWLQVHARTNIISAFHRSRPLEFENIKVEQTLFYAVDLGLVHVTQELLDRGSDPNAKDDYGETALHRVAINGNKPIALMLLKSGASVDAVNGYCQTPLHWAAWSENYEMVDMLLAWGADINAPNGGGETALHYAASDHPKMLKFLLHEGAYHGVRSLRGETPLDWAVSDSARECVDALLEADARATGALGNMRSL